MHLNTRPLDTTGYNISFNFETKLKLNDKSGWFYA